VAHASLAAGTKYMVVSWNADGSISGVDQATAA